MLHLKSIQNLIHILYIYIMWFNKFHKLTTTGRTDAKQSLFSQKIVIAHVSVLTMLTHIRMQKLIKIYHAVLEI